MKHDIFSIVGCYTPDERDAVGNIIGVHLCQSKDEAFDKLRGIIYKDHPDDAVEIEERNSTADKDGVRIVATTRYEDCSQNYCVWEIREHITE
jgi:hypothetical protein